jgi:hypothetical protein
MRSPKTRSGKPRVRRGLWWALGIVVFVLCAGVGAIQIFGNDMGEACKDSYSCKGFLLGGAECVDIDGNSFCTRYCDDDSDCPDGWSCRNATPTVLTVKTSTTDEVCMPTKSTKKR